MFPQLKAYAHYISVWEEAGGVCRDLQELNHDVNIYE